MNSKNIGQSIGWFWKTSNGIRLKAVVNVLMGIFAVLLDFLFIWATKRSIDVATGTTEGSLVWAVVLLGSSMLATILLSYASSWVSALLDVKSNNKMRLRTFSQLMRRVWGGKDDLHSGDIMNRLMTDSARVTSVITDTVPAIVTVLFRLAGAFLFLFSMQRKLALILLFIAPAFLLASRLYVRRMRHLSKEIRTTESRIQSIVQENIQNRMVMQTFEQTDEAVKLLSNTQDHQAMQVRAKTRFSSTSMVIARLGFALGYLLTFVWGAFSLKEGVITYGMMVAFMQLVGQIQGPFQSMMGLLPSIIEGTVSADRLRELDNSPLEQEGESVWLGTEVGVRISDVSFTYGQDGSGKVFDHFSHDFKPGSVTALIGETGAGKTTLFRLILALVKPDSGTVSIYNASEDVPASPQTRCNLVYVPQGNTLFSGTVRDNLLLGNPEVTDEQLLEVLKTACCDFILEDSEGLDKLCAEDGIGFSEGQAQRLSIARSLLRRGSVLLFDESTSALDIATEKRLISNLRLGMKDRNQTVIFITHRSAILECCSDVLDIKAVKMAHLQSSV